MRYYLVINPKGKERTILAKTAYHAKNLCQPMDKFKYSTQTYKAKLINVEHKK